MKILCQIFFLFIVIVSPAQDYTFRHYTTNDGLPSSECYDLLQDQQGYIWISTDNGVSKFDGYKFQNLTIEEGLKDHVVFHLKEYPAGRIWMSTLSGELYYFEKDTILPFLYAEKIAALKPYFTQLGDYLFDKAGNYYGVYFGLGIVKIDKLGQVTVIIDEAEKAFFAIHVDGQYLLSKSNGTQEWKNKLDTKVVSHTVFKNELFDYNLFSYINSIGAGFECFQYADSIHFMRFGVALFEIDSSKQLNLLLEDLRVSAFAEQQKALLFGFDLGKGVRYYKNYQALQAKQFTSFLEGYSVSHLLPDRDGGLWVATLEDGIFYAPNPSVKVLNKNNIFSNNNCKALTKDKDHNLYVGLVNGRIYQIGETGHLGEIKRELDGFYDIEYDDENEYLWIAGIAKDTILNGKIRQNERFAILDFNPSMVLTMRKFSSKPKQGVFYGCNVWHYGLIRAEYDHLHQQLKLTKLANTEVWTQAALEDNRGRIWVGCNDGLYQLKNDKFQFVDLQYNNNRARIEDIKLLTDGTLVLGTKGGGVIFWNGEEATQITTKEELVANEIEVVYIDEDQTIWIGTLEGGNKITISDEGFEMEAFTTFDGLPSNEINDFQQIKDKIWIATTKGLINLPKDFKADTMTIKPTIDQVLVNNQSLPPFDQLAHHQNNINIKFKSLDYKQNSKIDYRYRLGKDSDWQQTEVPSINLVSLAPNKYHFEVQAKNRGGYWSEATHLNFDIKPPFWQTWWFMIWISALMIGGTFWMIKRRNQFLSKRIEVTQEMNRLRQLSLQSQMNPHFVFNCLNAIQGFIAKGDRKNGTRYLSKFSNLVRAVLHISSKPFISVEEEIAILTNYLELEKMRFGNRLSYHFEIDEALDQLDAILPPLLVQPIVENAIIHGFQKNQEILEILVKITQLEEVLQITVQDNGGGFRENKSFNKIYTKNHESMGLDLIGRRLALLAKEPSAVLLKKENITEKDGSVLGARVELLITQST